MAPDTRKTNEQWEEAAEMSLLAGLKAAASGLTAQRLRMDVISSNVANATTTRTEEGGPYRRSRVVFMPIEDGSATYGPTQLARARAGLPLSAEATGVQVSAIDQDPSDFKVVHDPTHPDADANGNVAYPNVDVVTEMTDMLSATRSYEANVTVLNALKSMAVKALELGRA